MEDSCSDRHYLGFDPWFRNPVHGREPQVRAFDSSIDVLTVHLKVAR